MRAEIKKFAELMDKRITEKQKKYGGDTWKTASVEGLLIHLEDEVRELRMAFEADNADNLKVEAVDVSNLAMMMIDVSGGL